MKHWAEETGSDAQKGSKHLALLTMIHASNKRALELCHFDVTKALFDVYGTSAFAPGRRATVAKQRWSVE